MRALLRQYDRVQEFFRGKVQPPRTARVAVGTFTAESIVPRALVLLNQRLPKCEIDVLVTRGAERILGTAAGDSIWRSSVTTGCRAKSP